MKRLRQILLAGFYLVFLPTLYAQQNKQLTLEELIPGGKNFYRFYPKIPVEYQWYGDNLIALKSDSAWIIKNPEKPFEATLFHLQRYSERLIRKNSNRLRRYIR